jgi:hypothetical protein
MAVVQIQSREDFLQALMDRLMVLKESNVLVIIETSTGLEMIQTVPSTVWTYGILKAADALNDEKFRATVFNENTKSQEESIASRMKESIGNGNKGTN